MGPKSRIAPPEPPPLLLAVTREEARQKIELQIERGKKVLDIRVNSEDDLNAMRAEDSKWEKYTEELLKRLFTNNTLAEEFSQYWGGIGHVNESVHDMWVRLREDVNDHIHRLDSIKERLELIPEQAGIPRSAITPHVPGAIRKIFVVHGHDEGKREAVCRFLERLKLEPIVLHEQANKGNTVIEKFEANADVAFAVVLLTADDLGASKAAKDKLQPRARQNVILELGYFTGRIGRNRVCALYEQGVELPSDFNGVVYVSLDGGTWHLSLAKEIKAAGIDIDMNLAI